jgi:hypothetical protein
MPNNPRDAAPANDPWALPAAAFDWILANIEGGSTIVEFGSGEGTAALAAAGYVVISLEHDARFAGAYRGPNAFVYHAPLSPATDDLTPWYDRSVVRQALNRPPNAAPVALVIIDGPPGDVGRDGVLDNLDLLPQSAPILVDDTHRPAEAAMARLLAEHLGAPTEVHAAGDGRTFTVVFPPGAARTSRGPGPSQDAARESAPAKDPGTYVVAAMIVKNEAKNLPGLFQSAAPLVDAWCIVDTGSTDDTRALAAKLGEEHGTPVYLTTDPWDDDFGRSRNVSLDHTEAHLAERAQPARGPVVDPWILWLDGDDRVVNAPGLRAALEEADAAPGDYASVLGLRCTSHKANGSTETVVQVRAWRQSTRIRFRYPAHPVPTVPTKQDVGAVPGAWINHVGYKSAEHERANWQTNLRVAAKMPAGHPHRLLCELRAHAALGNLDEAEAAADHLQACLDAGTVEEKELDVTIYVVPAMAALLRGDLAGAAGLLALGAESPVFTTHPDLWFAFLQVAAIGYLTGSAEVAAGSPVMAGSTGSARKILAALNNAGLFDQPLPLHVLDGLDPQDPPERA